MPTGCEMTDYAEIVLVRVYVCVCVYQSIYISKNSLVQFSLQAKKF